MSTLNLTVTVEDLEQLDQRVNRAKGESRESFAVEALRERLAKTKPVEAKSAKAKATKAAEPAPGE